MVLWRLGGASRLVPLVDKAPLPLRKYADKLLKGENQSRGASTDPLVLKMLQVFMRVSGGGGRGLWIPLKIAEM